MLFQQYIPGEDNPNKIVFDVLNGSAKKTDLIYLCPSAPTIKYVQHEYNKCIFSGLEYALFDPR